jgi:hypothetical protein
MSGGKQIGPAQLIVGVVVLVLLFGFLYVRYFGSPFPKQREYVVQEGEGGGALPGPGDPRAYRQGLPRSMQGGQTPQDLPTGQGAQ